MTVRTRGSAPHAVGVFATLAFGCAMVLDGGVSHAASHSDAPLIKQDPQANLTDVYTFVGTKFNDPDTKVLNVVVSVRPFSEPGDGPHYERFADETQYSIHIANPVTGETVLRYDFQFSGVNDDLKNPNTILSYGLGTEPGAIGSIGDARQNYTQTYSVERSESGSSAMLGSGLLVAPPNAGKNVTPAYNDKNGVAVSGAAVFSELDEYTKQAIVSTPLGEALFAGPREDGFYADIPAIFDLLDARILDTDGDPSNGLGQDGNGVDGFKGYNVLTYGIQIPVDDLPVMPTPIPFHGLRSGVGVYASVSRRAVTTLEPDGTMTRLGPFVQVNRMGNPLFNEAFVALGDKDAYNRTSPTGDANFATYAETPELAGLINLIFGTEFEGTGRVDLVEIYIPDVIRVATDTEPVRLSGESGFSRLGILGADVTTDFVPSGWPNGRRFGDDVIDIALTALASGPAFTTITELGDNVPDNDAVYNLVFPYAATPHSGTKNKKDPVGVVADLNGDGTVDWEDLLILLASWSFL